MDDDNEGNLPGGDITDDNDDNKVATADDNIASDTYNNANTWCSHAREITSPQLTADIRRQQAAIKDFSPKAIIQDGQFEQFLNSDLATLTKIDNKLKDGQRLHDDLNNDLKKFSDDHSDLVNQGDNDTPARDARADVQNDIQKIGEQESNVVTDTEKRLLPNAYTLNDTIAALDDRIITQSLQDLSEDQSLYTRFRNVFTSGIYDDLLTHMAIADQNNDTSLSALIRQADQEATDSSNIASEAAKIVSKKGELQEN